jgi:lipoate-protein ligase A
VEAELTPGNTPSGIPNSQSGTSRPPQLANSAVCFDAPSWYELAVEGKKLVGSAQTRRNGCLLQHGSIPLQLDPDLLFTVLNYASEELRAKAKAFLLSKATDLEQVLAYQPEFSQLCACFQQGLAYGLRINLVRQQLLNEELKLAEHLAINKYRTMLWNGRK